MAQTGATHGADDVASITLDDDTDTPGLSVVMPAYNEANALAPLVTETAEVLDGAAAIDDYEIVIVDDGSDDDTWDTIHHIAELYDQVRGVQLARNFGQSAALAAGFETAAGETVVPMDADGQNDPADIPDLIAELDDGYDCVSGWRRDRQDPLTKRVPSRIQTWLATYTGPDIHDFGCTLTAYRADALEAVDLWGEGHRYIPAKLYHRGYSITEQEVNHRPRTAGESHYGLSRLARGFVDLVWHAFLVRFSTRPMHVFGTLGLVLLGIGSVLGGHLTLMKVVFNEPIMPHLARVVLVALLILSGVMVFSLGLLSEMLTKVVYRDDRPYRIERLAGRE